jgi:hypothetical protein
VFDQGYIGRYEIPDDKTIRSLIKKYGLLAVRENSTNVVHLWLPHSIIGIKSKIDDISVLTNMFPLANLHNSFFINDPWMLTETLFAIDFGGQANLATKMQAAIDEDLGINVPSGGARRATIMFIKDGKTYTRKVHVNSRGTMCVKFANALIPISKLKKL